MPMTYDMSWGTVATPATQTTTVLGQGCILTTTAAGKPSAYVTAVWAGCGGNAMTTAGGGYIFANNWQTIGVTTTTCTPNPKNINFAAASAGYYVQLKSASGFALGTGTQTVRIVVNYAQTGGPGFWMAANPDFAVQIANGGTAALKGYMDFTGQTASASENLEGTVEWSEQ